MKHPHPNPLPAREREANKIIERDFYICRFSCKPKKRPARRGGVVGRSSAGVAEEEGMFLMVG
jgi:hypothetical protein